MGDGAKVDLSLCREVAETCASIRLRKTARTVNRFYEKVQQPAELSGTQFSLMVITALAGNPRVGDLAALLDLDQTTLSRNLKRLKNRELISILPGEDRRERRIRLTEAGRIGLNHALELWKDAQKTFLAGIGQDNWERLESGLTAARDAVQKNAS